MKHHAMNLVNFVRGCEPRKKDFDLYTPVVNEIQLNRRYHLPATFLLQYDAMLRADFRELFLSERDEHTELGVWFEMGRPLNEKVGIPWRGREGFDWDWYVNPGFLPAYTQEERRALIDEVFRYFKEIFGEYPRVAGSWILDAYSMEYMSEQYGMDAFCICREQFATDAYTLWGGYYNGGYYPSRTNMLLPAQDKSHRIHTPVFRMLGIDPIYAYDEKKYTPRLPGCFTMEPGWRCGQDRDVMEWYFRTYYQNPTLAQSHATTGQENSFGWKMIGAGYPLQAEMIRTWADRGDFRVETLGQTGRDFQACFDDTPAAALVALEDWSDSDKQAAWYSAKGYRAGLLYEEGCLYFRDLQRFDDRCVEAYYDTPCTAWDAKYEALPLVDNRLWSDGKEESGIFLEREVQCMAAAAEQDDRTLVLTVAFADGSQGSITLDEQGLTLTDCGPVTWRFGTSHALQGITGKRLLLSWNGVDYEAAVDGGITQEGSTLRIQPIDGVVRILP